MESNFDNLCEIPKLLLGDDDYSFLKSKKPFFEKIGLSVLTANSKEEVINLFKKEHPCVIGLDLNWADPLPSDFSGFEIARRLKEMDSTVTTIAISAHIGQAQYDEKLLEEGLFDGKLHKNDIGSENIVAIKQIMSEMVLLKKVRDNAFGEPLLIPLDTFKSFPTKIKREISKKVFKERSKMISALLDKFEWVVLCGQSIIEGAKPIEPEERKELEKKRRIIEKENKLPSFYFTRPPRIETIVDWRPTRGDDYYPSLELKVLEDEFEYPLMGDYDTGCDKTHISDRFFIDDEYYDVESNFFLKDYDSYERPIEVVLAVKHKRKIVYLTRMINVNVVLGWEGSGFILYNNAREILIGRDIMKVFPSVTFSLNWGVKKTKTSIKGV